jgi:hypothetical protein
MTRAEVEEILGGPAEPKTPTTVGNWWTSEASKIRVDFNEHDRVVWYLHYGPADEPTTMQKIRRWLHLQ